VNSHGRNNLLAAGGNSSSSSASSLDSFYYAIKTKGTKKQYRIRLGYYFEFLGIDGASREEQASLFLFKAGHDHKWANDSFVSFMRYLKDRVDNRKLTGGTLNNYYAAVKLFYEMNDLELNWKKISRGLPPAGTVANDRAPTTEEIRKIIKYHDRRVRVIVLVMVSSGIRIGAWEYLKCKHLTPIYSPQNPQ
jgi:hypothetical protein